MKVLCLTGSIGMGKSTAARSLRALGLPVHDADQEVHRLLRGGGAAVAAIARVFPGTVHAGIVDRKALGARVFGDRAALARLEAILHPLVRRSTVRFLARARAQRRALVVLDIPLYFETGGRRICDAVMVVSAPAAIQRARVLARPGMTPDKFAAILTRQTPDREKRRRADLVVSTGLSRREALRHVRRAVKLIRQGRARRGRRRGSSIA